MFICIWLTKLLKVYFVCDHHHAIKPYYGTLKMYILKYGMYRLEVVGLCFVMYISSHVIWLVCV
ncbi:hypothetical protein F383_27285 [Gossypium arboreum]|uniref:Uncharacterized protein n=1 Tax=Gossypium arboreum TaxID=29729 RepID=A0A0B0PDE1_GOSAR|nr:hypothetical protein F383_27285 [Gossypium arboreum]